ncbi:ExeM/NucH family extracellular endonuclease [Nocardioides sp. CPCC 205120]|uniref:ExeM/NucH family extracellular endonuclease n=1 Tax=Nocardioides sp. CPCC 205120 TaxID=3406462 RepID=UPI003B513D57
MSVPPQNPPAPARRATRSRARRALAAGLGAGVAATCLVAAPSQANPAGTGLVISEVYGGGGNSGAAFSNDFIELYNPTGAAISLDGLALQYRSAAGGSGGVQSLTGSVAPGSYFLVQAAAGSNTSLPALPAPDATAPFNMSGSAGQVLLLNGTSAFTGSGDLAGNAALVDALGWGSATTSFETAPAAGTANATSVARTAPGTDTDSNTADFRVGAPTPQGSGAAPDPDPEPDPEPETPTAVSIAQIQGTGASTPLAGQRVSTTGVVTAAYPTGGFNGFYVQTGGTGGTAKAAGSASDAVFVYGGSSGFATYPEVGDSVQVVGTATEFGTLTQVDASAGTWTELATPLAAVTPRAFALPGTDAEREMYEGELVAPSQSYTVSNNYNLNNFGEIGLALGDLPLLTPTEVADPQDAEALAAVIADNAARAIALDDGASTNFLSTSNGGANKDIPLPWITPERSVRVNAGAEFTAPVVLDYRNNTWKYQPTTQLTATGAAPATFEDTRTASPEDVGGDLQLATFNVLNYFSTTGEDFVESGAGTCSYYTDRDGAPVTNNRCNPDGPRGAADQENLERQQAKIVAAINAIDADVMSLEEIENSAAFGRSRDLALATLVEALNADAGSERWAFVPSPNAVPASEDVIRTAFIYQRADVETVGASRILLDSTAFANARQPLAQAFKARGASDDSAFTVVVNHFKSKGDSSPPATGDNANGLQGAFNGDRVRQAEALTAFADEVAEELGTEAVFLAGDFNSYSMEDPIQVLEEAGYTNLSSDDEWTYSFSGQSGSLDHVLANEAALATVTGSDIWEINAVEPISYEYSRYNYNATDFYSPDPYRSSDHEPHVIGISADQAPVESAVVTSPTTGAYGDAIRIPVEIDTEGAGTGTVEAIWGGRVLGSAEVVDGRATIVLPRRQLAPNTYRVGIRYSGDSTTYPSTGGVVLTVGKARSVLVTAAWPQPIAPGARGTLGIEVGNSSGAPANGWANVVYGGHALRVQVVNGFARVSLPPVRTAGWQRASIYFEGSATINPAFATLGVKVGR